jgi:hypothetical protein
MRRYVGMLVVVMVAGLATGCTPDLSPLERGTNKVVDGMASPVLVKAVDKLDPATAQMQGQGTILNPKYVVKGHTVVGTGVAFEFSVGIEGASANLAAATQSDRPTATATATQPAKTEATERPAPPEKTEATPKPAG